MDRIRKLLQDKGVFAMLSSIGAISTALLLTLLFAIFGIGRGEQVLPNTETGSRVEYTAPNGSTYVLSVEVANELSEWEQGLMGRTQLDANRGMLFVFPNNSVRAFWMKDTLITLDIIFLDDSGKVVTIYTNTTPNQTTELYSSILPARYALEVNAGWSNKVGLKVGEKLLIDLVR